MKGKPETALATIDAEAIVTETRVLGADPRITIKEASEIATVLAEVIEKQKLYANIQGKKFPTCEGWTTLGVLIGVSPVEEYVKELPNGYETKIKLIRTKDGQTVGAASHICLRSDEPRWANSASYAIRSMSGTRATGKAFRQSFSWIMKLAGYEVTPAEEITSTTFRPSIPPPESIRERQARAPQPSYPPPAEDYHEPEPEPPADYELEAPAATINAAQQRKLWATARKCGWTEDDVRQLAQRHGVESTKDFPAAGFTELLNEILAGTRN